MCTVPVFCYDEYMKYEDLLARAVEIRHKYDQLNQIKRGMTWNEQQIMAGFVGDIGDLSKIIMAKHGQRDMDNVDDKLAHELSDCLWSILVLASTYNINLADTFMKSMDELSMRIDKDLDQR